MKHILGGIAVSAILSLPVFAQYQESEPERPPMKVVVTNSMPAVRPAPITAPKVTPTPAVVTEQPHGPSAVSAPSAPISVPTDTSFRTASTGLRPMSFAQIKNKIAEAKREMQMKPVTTGSSEPVVPTEFVRIAFLDSKTQKVDFVVMTKDAFLDVNSDKQTVSQAGRRLTVHTIRGNGVNTPLSIVDDSGTAHMPLIAQYPVIRDGKYTETAYYVSTHNGLVTSDVVNAGRYYVRNVIEIARDRLRAKGVTIQPGVADIAERLATVEHVDHMRFKTEYQPNIYNDIFTLYALNEGQTYRYSVSSAGAGGMVQMIPATYRLIRSMYPNVGLMPDFVEGMRNHVNATQAMLLYMQMTWNDLSSSPTINDAMASKIATQPQLMAAGYNSNPAKLAGYINRGGSSWTSLIPRETQMYLQIYDSLDKYVPMTPRSR